MMKVDTDNSSFNEFKKSEKKFKYYVNKETDWTELVELTDEGKKKEQTKLIWEGIKEFSITHPKTGKEVKGYRFSNPEGLIVLKDYTTIEDQLTICRDSLNIYHRKPHRTNLYIYQNDEKKPEEPQTCQSCPQKDQKDQEDKDQKDNENNTNTKNNPAKKEEPKALLSKRPPSEPLPRAYNKAHYLISSSDRYFFNSKIRWSNVGKQYNWDNRDYLDTESKMPSELEGLAQEIVEVLKLGDYSPQALIINYYGWRNVMGGHLDDGEPDQAHPILSFSFGLSCVFLIGGESKTTPPMALRLDSGDVMIMGERARKCFHGVPRIIETSKERFSEEKYLKEAQRLDQGVSDEGRKALEKFVEASGDEIKEVNCYGHVLNYFKENRLNLNFRQVVL